MKQFLIGAGVLLLGVSVMAEPTHNDLREVEAQLRQERLAQKESERKAAVLTQEVKSVQGKLVTTAKQIQSHEGRLSLLEQKKVELEARRKHLEQRLNLSNKQLARIMKVYRH